MTTLNVSREVPARTTNVSPLYTSSYWNKNQSRMQNSYSTMPMQRRAVKKVDIKTAFKWQPYQEEEPDSGKADTDCFRSPPRLNTGEFGSRLQREDQR